MTPATQPAHRLFSFLPTIIGGITLLTLVVGFLGLHILETRLLAATGEQLAIAAADIADKLDLLLYERYGDIQIMARTAATRVNELQALVHEVESFRRVFPVYSWIGVADANGLLIAATDHAGIGQDQSRTPWFRAARERGGVQVHDAQVWEETGGVRAVAFSAPIMGADGAFLGVVTSRVGIPVLAEHFSRTVRSLQIGRGSYGVVEWQFLTSDGILLADSVLHEEEAGLNLRTMGLPSVSMEDSLPGYIVEPHLRRKVPVLTGYARTGGNLEFEGLHWRVLIRIDQGEVLAPIRAVLWRLGAAGAVIVVPLIGVLFWSTRRLTATNQALMTEIAEHAISEDRFRRVVESAPFGMIIVNQAGLIQLVNTQAEQLFGYRRDELLGQPVERLVPEDVRPQHPAHRALFQAAPLARPIGLGRGLRARRKDGIEFPVEISLVPLSMHDVPVVLAAILDISERKQAEEALRVAQAELLDQQRLEKEHVEAELTRTRDALIRQTRLATVGELAAGIAHDLRNPLGAIRNACHLLKRRVPAEDRKTVEYVGIVEEEVTASDRIISNLLEIARGKLPSKASVSLASVVEKAFQQAHPAPTIRRRLTFEPDPFMVWGDPTQLQRVLHNLILNAAQAMETGGEIRITARHAGRDDEILVADDGPGIPAAQRAQVFEPLYTTKADGTGLGLTICRQLIERHGGSIELLEHHHPGTAFVLRLPRLREAGVVPENAVNGQPLTGGGSPKIGV